MHRPTLLPALLLLAGCAHTLPESEWVTTLPRGACRVTIERNDATGTWTLERHHADDGRVLSGTARLRYYGRAWERFAYDPRGRLAEIHSYEDIDAEDFPCTSIGGCYTPPLRVLTRTALRHDDTGRLVGWSFDERTYGRQPDGSYTARRGEHYDRAYSYDAEGRLSEITRGNLWTRFTYAGERLVRVTRGGEFPSFTTAEHDASGRIVATTAHACTRAGVCHVSEVTRYVYDTAGRLVRADRRATSGDTRPRYSLWVYEGERLVRATNVEVHSDATDSRRVFEYTYDQGGRLASLAQDGQVRERRSYEGTCDAVPTGPRAPSALADLGAVVCPQSPAFVMDQCFTAP